MKIKQTLFLLSFLFVVSGAQGKLSLSAVFTDNMVLQRQTEAPVWGKATPSQTIHIFTSWDKQEYTTIADTQGNWNTKLSTPEAGGPYTIEVYTNKKNRIHLNNVLIGDVWLCSGQSNMEWRVRNDINNMDEEIQNANYPHLRMITLEKQTSTTPTREMKAEREGWEICSPNTVAEFSSVAYFFGREIHQSQEIPVGLINTSWGGTLAEAWTDTESLEQMPYFRDFVQSIRQMPEAKELQEQFYQQNLTQWLIQLNKKDPGFIDQTPLWADKDYIPHGWSVFTVPGMIQEQGISLQNGIFWCRKEIEIPSSWEGEELIIHLGTLDDDDFTYFNGVQIGYTEGWMTNRTYQVPANIVKAGKAVITVRLFDTGGSGGFGGTSNQLYIESSKGKLSLAGEWNVKFALSSGEIGLMPRRPDGNVNEPTVLYNTMIHPLVPYAIKGAIWYQGEANTGRAYQYRELLPLMINGWRKQFGHDFPFYIVQLANHMKLQTKPCESTWAELREAQLQTLHLDNTGLAVTIDIGEADDIHPRNKQDVGLRLALAARANTYQENISFSGPLYSSYRIEGNKIRISFTHTNGGLQTRENEPVKGFTIAGPDHQFHWAEAVIEGNEIIVSSPEVDFPVAVRYAWADNPICNLYNGANLPASPFRTDDWQGITY